MSVPEFFVCLFSFQMSQLFVNVLKPKHSPLSELDYTTKSLGKVLILATKCSCYVCLFLQVKFSRWPDIPDLTTRHVHRPVFMSTDIFESSLSEYSCSLSFSLWKLHTSYLFPKISEILGFYIKSFLILSLFYWLQHNRLHSFTVESGSLCPEEEASRVWV